jgi:DMSO/TMAO reductase YedYZ molybdopterin-dependent catalytic subunit
MIVQTSLPVQLETPFTVFDEGLYTPNDAFFVRWHLAGIPTKVDASAFRVRVHGLVNGEMSLSVDELRRDFDAVQLAAVCECSGNSRGFFSPRVPGGQWANGAMGNAVWKGARLRDVLNKAGVKAGAVQVRFNGADTPVMKGTPDFVKALDMDRALHPDTLVAYEMNGKPLPLLNGYPVRLIVPGWFATYWVKMLNGVEVIDHVEDNFWMKTAYRIPATPNGSVAPGSTGFPTVPINRLTIRSFITNLSDGQHIAARRTTAIGITFDSGNGIKTVEFSSDGGATWKNALLGPDRGKYGFRQWTASFTPESGKSYELMCRATGTTGDTQSTTPVWNPAGYLRNVPETVKVTA